MTMRHKISILTWSGVALAALMAPAVASAQDAGEGDRNVGVRERYKPEYQPLGIRAGAFMIRPDISAEVEYNDNVYATDGKSVASGGSGPKLDDVIYRIIPAVDIRSDWSRNEIGIRAKLTDWKYQDFSSEERTDWNVNANGRLDVGARGSIRASGGYEDGHESRQDAGSPFAASEPVEVKSTYGSIGATQEFNRLQLAADATYREYDYQDVLANAGGVIDEDVRDYNRADYVARADYAMPKGGVVFVEAGYNKRSYEQDTPLGVGAPLNQDSDGYRVLVGTRLDLSNLLRGELAVGYMDQKYDDARLKDAKGLAVRADLQWFVTGITTIGFGGSREVQESGIFGGTGVQGGGAIATSVYGRVDHELLRNVVLSGDVAYRDYDYKSFDRNDNNIEAGLGVDYLMNRLLRFGLEYRYDDRSSDGVDAASEFTANRLIFKVTARF